MAIENRNLAAGTKLVATYKKAEHFCDVLKQDDVLVFQLRDGQTFKSPSSAGKAITGRVSCDGWKFWSLANGATPAASPEAPADEPSEAPQVKAEPKTKMIRVIKKMPNQKAVPEGSTKFWCSSCMKAFVVEGLATPEHCPENHQREMADEFAAIPTEANAAD